MSIERERLAEDLFSFVLSAPHANTEALLTSELMRRVSAWGVTHAGACVMSDAHRTFKPGPRFGRNNVPWMDAYFGMELFKDDPVMDFALRAERADYWDKAIDIPNLSKGAKRVLDVASEFGASDGYMVPVPLFNGDIMIVSYQGPHLERHPDVAGLLRGLASTYAIEGQRRVVKSRKPSDAFASLTARQLQIVHLKSHGLRDVDVAARLGISVATVAFHLSRARRRLGAANTTEAVALLQAVPENPFDPL